MRSVLVQINSLRSKGSILSKTTRVCRPLFRTMSNILVAHRDLEKMKRQLQAQVEELLSRCSEAEKVSLNLAGKSFVSCLCGYISYLFFD